ncbi:MAG: hypothetical protein PF439_07890 [Helicobacteraceae bacterium]|jgi:cell division protein FtsL|nr:hypothetical protein [Helicobacteraceae bacterium]
MSKLASFGSVVLLFLLLSVVVVFGFMVFTPKVKTYRALNIELQNKNLELELLEERFDKEYASLQRLQERERNIDIALQRHFNLKAFETYLNNYFTSVTLGSLKSLQLNDLMIHELDVQAQITSPDEYYRFLEALNGFAWVVEVDGTLQFKGLEDGISTRFIVKVYTK